MADASGASFLFISQVYLPDPAAVGQQLADAAEELVRRGHRVVVVTADRGYDDPSARYPRYEVHHGVEIQRLRWSSFGKRSFLLRMFGALLFVLQAVWRGLREPRLHAVVVSTVPPIAPLAALALHRWRNVPLKYWIMDLNPDQLVALRVLPERSWIVRLLNVLVVRTLRAASDVIVLDRYMAQRVVAKADIARKVSIVPPWAHEQHASPVPHGENPFRHAQGFDGKRVIMYSGNHGMTNPLATLLDTARQLQGDDSLAFCFVGGGVQKRMVDAMVGPTIRSLPYQPLDQLRYSLSAADVHVVSLGNEVVGIVHPCKIYGAMAVARPILLFGPAASHLGELVEGRAIGWRVDHGDVAGAVAVLRRIADMPADQLAAIGARARAELSDHFSAAALCGTVCDVLERDVLPPDGRATNSEGASVSAPSGSHT